jgi:long-subunit acyl-CoA synthetase (AMP-forming)
MGSPPTRRNNLVSNHYLSNAQPSSQTATISSGANPDFSTNELLYQLQATKATLLISSPEGLVAAEAAAKQHGLSSDRILVFNTADSSPAGKVSIENMVRLGRTHAPSFQERRLKPGEGKTKLAFLSFSSGTTGRPKVRTYLLNHSSDLAALLLTLGFEILS